MAKRAQRKETPGRSGMPQRPPGGGGDGSDETGKALPLLRLIEREYPGNPRKQWSELMARMPINALTGRERELSINSRKLYSERGQVILSDLRTKEVNIRLQNISEFGKKAAYKLVRYWATTKRALQHDPDSASALRNLTTVVRRICIWNGLPHAVPKSLPRILEELGLDPDLARGHYFATESRAPRAKGIDPSTIVAAAREQLGELPALMIEGALLFGLREREVLELRPGESDEGGWLRVFRGVKNGRLERLVPIQTSEQRDWLDRAKAFCKTHRHSLGILTFQPMPDIETAIRHLQYLCSTIGLTGKGIFHCTFHGLRHQFAQDMYRRETGYDAPVVTGIPVPAEIDLQARQKVTKALGHHRLSVTSAYLGVNAMIEQPKRRVMDRTLAGFQEDEVQDALRNAGITRLVLAGKLAEGVLDPHDLTLCAYEGVAPSEPQQLEQLLALLERVTGTRCYLVPLSDAVMRRETLEVM